MALSLGTLVIGNLAFDEIGKAPECGNHKEHRKEADIENRPQDIEKQGRPSGKKNQEDGHEQAAPAARLIMLSVLHREFSDYIFV